MWVYCRIDYWRFHWIFSSNMTSLTPRQHKGSCSWNNGGSCDCEATSLTPLTVKKIIENIVENVAEYPHGRLALAVDLRDQLESLVTTLTTQHIKEKEEVLKEVLNGVPAIDHRMTHYDEDMLMVINHIKEIAKKHNITI